MLIVILVVGWMSIVVDALKYLCLSFFVYYMCFSIFIVCYFNLLLHSFAGLHAISFWHHSLTLDHVRIPSRFFGYVLDLEWTQQVVQNKTTQY